jgi:hypothetical protein
LQKGEDSLGNSYIQTYPTGAAGRVVYCLTTHKSGLSVMIGSFSVLQNVKAKLKEK